MTAAPSKQKRDYMQHGQNTIKKALRQYATKEEWLDSLGEVGQALREWQRAIICDLGGEDSISAMQRSIIELATKTHLLLHSVDQYLLEQKSLVNKRRRQLFPIVSQRQQLADSLARYMQQLGLKKQAKQHVDLASFLQNGHHDEPTTPDHDAE